MRVLIAAVVVAALAVLVLAVGNARAEEYRFHDITAPFYLPPVFVEGGGILICFSKHPTDPYVYELCGLNPKSHDDLNLTCTFARGGVRKANCVRSGL